MIQKQQDSQPDEASELEAPENEQQAMEEVQEEAAKERENERGYQ
jgi:hypothetical protein